MFLFVSHTVFKGLLTELLVPGYCCFLLILNNKIHLQPTTRFSHEGTVCYYDGYNEDTFKSDLLIVDILLVLAPLNATFKNTPCVDHCVSSVQ